MLSWIKEKLKAYDIWFVLALVGITGIVMYLSFYFIPDMTLFFKNVFDTIVKIAIFVLADKFIFWNFDTYEEIFVKRNVAYAGMLIALAIIINGSF